MKRSKTMQNGNQNKKEIQTFTQVSLDLTTIKEALEMAHGAVNAGIDWIEAGTPLILFRSIGYFGKVSCCKGPP